MWKSKADRENIVKRTDGKPAKLYVKKEQFKDKFFYIFVTCKEEDCSYTLKFEGEEFASININETYSYLVTNNNKEMIFKINEKVENDSYLTLGIDGYSDYAEFDIEDCDGPQFFFETGRVVICPFISENSSFFTPIWPNFFEKFSNSLLYFSTSFSKSAILWLPFIISKFCL